ncbi:MAG: hypothetical protein AMS22_00390 [Thiotrichales bacterium SG8_50]|nr:MAG: hypothetical protein AMS22_00390 [Thiotrichales bacterium SG8_50]
MSESLVGFLRQSVTRCAEAAALVHGDRQISYGELWTHVEAFAGFLESEGIQPGDRVAMLMENSPEYVAAYYSILAAGGAAVALNTAVRAQDLSAWVTHCGARWLIADAGHPELPALLNQSPAPLRVITVGAGLAGEPRADAVRWDDVPSQSGSRRIASPADSALATIIYTSGTTGHPKGVMLSHRNLAANVRSILDYLPIDATDRAMNVLPFYYSYGNSVLHTHLAAGATLLLENSMVFPHRVLQIMADQRATSFAGVPSTYALLLNRTRLGDYDLGALRYLTQAGGPMAPALMRRLREALPNARLFVMYGQTEATARLAYLPAERLEEKMGSAGTAIPGVTIEIRGETGEILPPDQVGEICATGDNLMLGYWHDPEATVRVLIDGWLHTGDMAYRDAEGFLYIQGRRSDMIKTGAHRVNPREIEEAIIELDWVADVAVVGVDDDILGQVIKAVIVPRPGLAVDPMRVKAHCRERLATYKIPKFVEHANELPRTASGKVKRYLLAG